MMEHVVLVDADDREVGIMEKLTAHRHGRLHRAVSVFLFDHRGRLLLQKRSEGKYHSGGLWSNTCCTHPRPGEATIDAAHRRLQEEMGIEARLAYAFSTIYDLSVGSDLVEHEFNHIFVGMASTLPHPDPAEVSSWRWASERELHTLVHQLPALYSSWFRLLYRRAISAAQGSSLLSSDMTSSSRAAG